MLSFACVVADLVELELGAENAVKKLFLLNRPSNGRLAEKYALCSPVGETCSAAKLDGSRVDMKLRRAGTREGTRRERHWAHSSEVSRSDNVPACPMARIQGKRVQGVIN